MRLFSLLFVYVLLGGSIGVNGQNVIDSLESSLLNAKDTSEVDILNNLSFQYYYKSMQKSDSFAVLAVDKAKEIGYQKGLAFGYVNWAYTTSKLRTKKEAIHLFGLAFEAANSVGNARIMAQAKNGIGSTLLNLALYDSSLQAYNVAYESFYKLQDSAGMSGALNNIGIVYDRKGDYKKAIAYYHNAYEINTGIGYKRKQIRNLLNIGLIYVNRREEQRAKKYYEEANVLLEGTDWEKYKADALNGLAMVYKNEGDLDKAEQLYRRAKTHVLNANDRLGAAVIGHNLSDLHLSQNKFQLALRESLEALEIKKEINNPKSIVFSLSLISEIYWHLKNGEKALEFAKENLQLVQDLGLKDRERVALNNVAKAYSLLGNFNKAYLYKTKYINLQDSLFNTTKAEQIAQMEAEFQSERKQQQIELQNQKISNQKNELSVQKKLNTIYLIGGSLLFVFIVVLVFQFLNQRKLTNQLFVKNKLISEQNLEKETLLKEIHHRVKNNLQVISSLLNLQSRHLSDDSAKEAVRESQSRIKSMSLIHQRLYTDNNMATIEMPQYLKELTDFLFATFKPAKGIEKQVEVEKLQFDVDLAVPLGLIINELISNSLKHAFDAGGDGMINLKLKSVDDLNYQLIIADDGKGINAIEKHSKSMGMKLVETLVEQINARMEVATEKGTAYKIMFSSTLS